MKQAAYSNPQAHAEAVQAARMRHLYGTSDPRSAWEKAKAAQRTPGRSEVDAIRLAMRAHPELYAALATYQPPAQAATRPTPSPVKGQWDAAVALKVSTGMARSAAITAVMKQQPDLYAEYSAAGKTKGGR